MIYSNDESDRLLRQKNFYLAVYALPFCLALSICSLIYLASTANNFIKENKDIGFEIAILLCFSLYAYNKKNWLKMPDGTCSNIKGITPANKINLNEPTKYDVEYFYSKKGKIILILVGFGLISIGIGNSIWLGFQDVGSMLTPICTSAVGIYIFYLSIKQLLDKSAKLKFSKKGLWTNKLGFVDWNDIAKTQVIIDTRRHLRTMILEIYIKGTVFSEANQPDERLYLTDLGGKEHIETVADILMSKRNEPAT